MPEVDGKKYPYTKEGIKAAEKAKKKKKGDPLWEEAKKSKTKKQGKNPKDLYGIPWKDGRRPLTTTGGKPPLFREVKDSPRDGRAWVEEFADYETPHQWSRRLKRKRNAIKHNLDKERFGRERAKAKHVKAGKTKTQANSYERLYGPMPSWKRKERESTMPFGFRKIRGVEDKVIKHNTGSWPKTLPRPTK